MTISVIVLTHDRKRLLRDCLDSLLAQSYPGKIEIVVSDDGSSDGTREMVAQMQARDARIKYLYQPHRGIAAARNNGIAHATGDIVAIVADDYILDPSYVSTIVQFFDERQRRRSSVSRWSLRAETLAAVSATSTLM